MIPWVAGDKELHCGTLFLIHELRYLRLVARQAHNFGNHLP